MGYKGVIHKLFNAGGEMRIKAMNNNRGNVKTVLFAIVFIGLISAIFMMNQRILKEIDEAGDSGPSFASDEMKTAKKARNRPDLMQGFPEEVAQKDAGQVAVAPRKAPAKKVKPVYEQPMDSPILVQ